MNHNPLPGADGENQCSQEEIFFAGVDIGGTNTVVGITDTSGTILARDIFPTRSGNNIAEFIDILYHRVKRLAAQTDTSGRLAGVGIGAPNVNRNGEITLCENLPWQAPVALSALVKEKFHLPVSASNDANAAAVGEMTYGAARGMTDFIMITLGTGVGSGIVADGRLLCGSRGLAGELGHTAVFSPGGRQCGCGKTVCLEAYCSATGVTRTAREMLTDGSGRPSTLRQVPLEAITSRDVYEAALKGDALAIDVFSITGDILGRALAQFMAFSDPQAFILFGGLAKSGEMLLKPLRESFRRNLLPL